MQNSSLPCPFFREEKNIHWSGSLGVKQNTTWALQAPCISWSQGQGELTSLYAFDVQECNIALMCFWARVFRGVHLNWNKHLITCEQGTLAMWWAHYNMLNKYTSWSDGKKPQKKHGHLALNRITIKKFIPNVIIDILKFISNFISCWGNRLRTINHHHH